jgi:hypothetical protein
MSALIYTSFIRAVRLRHYARLESKMHINQAMTATGHLSAGMIREYPSVKGEDDAVVQHVP